MEKTTRWCGECGAETVWIDGSDYCPNCEQPALNDAISKKYSRENEEASTETPQWPRPIPVSERLPEWAIRVLVYEVLFDDEDSDDDGKQFDLSCYGCCWGRMLPNGN